MSDLSPSMRASVRTEQDTAERYRLIVPADVDKRGKVVVPAIDFATGMMPNGQPIISFYERGHTGVDDAEWLARMAVGKAAKRLLRDA